MGFKVENLFFSYGKRKILEDISVEIPMHSVFSILGPNGSGKTTFLKCLNNFFSIKSGRITLFEKDIRDYSLQEKAREIAYVPQQSTISFQMNAIDTILQGRIPHSGRKFTKKDFEIVYSLIKRFNLEELSFRNINELSGGQRQLILIARALAQEPKFLILDEPTAALDLKNQIFLLGELEKMTKERELAVIMTIHDLNLAAMFSTHIMTISKNKLYALGTPKEVLSQKMIKDTYGVVTDIIDTDEYPFIRIDKNKNIQDK